MYGIDFFLYSSLPNFLHSYLSMNSPFCPVSDSLWEVVVLAESLSLVHVLVAGGVGAGKVLEHGVVGSQVGPAALVGAIEETNQLSTH